MDEWFKNAERMPEIVDLSVTTGFYLQKCMGNGVIELRYLGLLFLERQMQTFEKHCCKYKN